MYFNFFHSNLEKYKETVDKALQKDLEQSNNKFTDFQEAFRTLATKIGGELAVHGPNGYEFTTNPNMHNIERRKQFIELMFRPYVDILLNEAKMTSKT